MDLTLILLIIALVLLILAALNVSFSPVHLGWAGLALVVLTFILDRTGS